MQPEGCYAENFGDAGVERLRLGVRGSLRLRSKAAQSFYCIQGVRCVGSSSP